MSDKKRYAVVGLGGRSEMFLDSITKTYKEIAQLVGFCDISAGRMENRNNRIQKAGHPPVPTFHPGQFDQMIAQTRPDHVIVTSMDVTHSDYICRAMELGCDVISEKPMTIDEQRCRKILKTAASTGKNCQVTFNYRYAPPRSQVRELIMNGAIGEILSVDFCWLLDTRHGADYFHRWHRYRRNSGSLLVHKATHHFDLVNWWLDDIPEEVFCHATKRFYTPQNADKMGLQGRSDRCLTCGLKEKCRFYLDITKGDLKDLYLDCENHNGYIRDRCIFAQDIDIWDSMSACVRYRRKTVLSYMLHAYSSYEGYKVAFNGTGGRIEHAACENTYINGDGTVPGELDRGNVSVTYIPAFSKPQALEPHTGKGGHGGGDPVLLADIFDPNASADPLRRKANQRDGAYSILVGIAACHSIDTGKAVRINDLLGDAPI